MPPRSPLLNVMMAAARKAAKGLLRDFGEVDKLQISRKGTANFVTSADLRTEKLLHQELKKARPGFGFLMEEGGEIKGEDASMRWVIDPLDGTSNFIHAIPYFCISIAAEKLLASGKGEVIAGIVYDPIHDEMFCAEKYGGAFLNDRRLAVSTRRVLEEAMFAGGTPKAGRHDYPHALHSYRVMTESGMSVRTPGAAALDLAYVAAGRFDGCWFHTLQPWDHAAGLLLVAEAGGIVCDQRDASGAGILLACSQTIHPQAEKLLQLPQAEKRA